MTGTRAIYQDATLPHQLRIVADARLDLIGVSCNCMQDEDGRFVPLTEPAHTFDPKEANAAYSAHLKEVSGP